MLLCIGQKQKVKNSLYNDNRDEPAVKGYYENKQPVATATARKSCLPTKYRKQKVLSIRRQLKEGRYDINKKLDAAMDRVLKELNE